MSSVVVSKKTEMKMESSTTTPRTPNPTSTIISDVENVGNDVEQLAQQCAIEIQELHRLFVTWFRGESPMNLLTSDLCTRLTPTFSHVAPNGHMVKGRTVLLQYLTDKYGCYQDRIFSIDVYNVQLLWYSTNKCLASYEEWQSWDNLDEDDAEYENHNNNNNNNTNLMNDVSESPSRASKSSRASTTGGKQQFGRLSTCLLEKDNTDGRFKWIHVHETWLEAEEPMIVDTITTPTNINTSTNTPSTMPLSSLLNGSATAEQQQQPSTYNNDEETVMTGPQPPPPTTTTEVSTKQLLSKQQPVAQIVKAISIQSEDDDDDDDDEQSNSLTDISYTNHTNNDTMLIVEKTRDVDKEDNVTLVEVTPPLPPLPPDDDDEDEEEESPLPEELPIMSSTVVDREVSATESLDNITKIIENEMVKIVPTLPPVPVPEPEQEAISPPVATTNPNLIQKVIVLIDEESLSEEEIMNQQFVVTTLMTDSTFDQNEPINIDIVNVNDLKNRVRRNVLFGISKTRTLFPQIFIIQKKTSSENDADQNAFYWGSYPEFMDAYRTGTLHVALSKMRAPVSEDIAVVGAVLPQNDEVVVVGLKKENIVVDDSSSPTIVAVGQSPPEEEKMTTTPKQQEFILLVDFTEEEVNQEQQQEVINFFMMDSNVVNYKTDIVDVNDPKNRVRRNELFGISELRTVFPQIFIMNKKDDPSSIYSYWGCYEEFTNALPNGTLYASLGVQKEEKEIVAPSSLEITSTVVVPVVVVPPPPPAENENNKSVNFNIEEKAIIEEGSMNINTEEDMFVIVDTNKKTTTTTTLDTGSNSIIDNKVGNSSINFSKKKKDGKVYKLVIEDDDDYVDPEMKFLEMSQGILLFEDEIQRGPAYSKGGIVAGSSGHQQEQQQESSSIPNSNNTNNNNNNNNSSGTTPALTNKIDISSKISSVPEETDEQNNNESSGTGTMSQSTVSTLVSPPDASKKRHVSPHLEKYAKPLVWENALVGVSIKGFDIGTSQGTVADSVWHSETTQQLETIAQSLSVPKPKRKLCIPEMIFPTAHVALEGYGIWLSWDATDALEAWAKCHQMIAVKSRIAWEGVSVLKSQDAKLWEQRAAEKKQLKNAPSDPAMIRLANSEDDADSTTVEANPIFHYDWTFSSPFVVKSEGGEWIELDESGMRMELLKDQSVPILFFDEIILYEDDLHDNGVVQYSVKLRVMPTCAYILARLFVRVDNVIIRLRETRILIDFFGIKPQIFRDITWKECHWDDLVKKNLPTSVKAWTCHDTQHSGSSSSSNNLSGSSLPSMSSPQQIQEFQRLLQQLPDVRLPKNYYQYAVFEF